VVSSAVVQEAETRSAVLGHTQTAMNIGADRGWGFASGDANLINDLNAYMYTKQSNNMDIFSAYSDAMYDSTADYWKLMNNGTLVNDNEGWLKNENGKYVNIDGSLSDAPIPGETIGADGVETGLLNILNEGTSNRHWGSYSEEQIVKAQSLLSESGMMHTVNPNDPTNRAQWMWDREGTFIDSVGGMRFPNQLDAGAINDGRVLRTDLLFSQFGDAYDTLLFNSLPAADAYTALSENNRNTFGLANFPQDQIPAVNTPFLKRSNRLRTRMRS
jgi:hypothetical protein